MVILECENEWICWEKIKSVNVGVGGETGSKSFQSCFSLKLVRKKEEKVGGGEIVFFKIGEVVKVK